MGTYKTIYCLVFLSFIFINGIAKNTINNKEPNIISIEKTDYGLIFTTIRVNNEEVKAMIDLGDQHKLQLSSSILHQMNIKTEKMDYRVSDIYGNIWDVDIGILSELMVGSWIEKNVEFTSQKGEMESVSSQIGTEFNAVLGWGYFKSYFTEIDYSNSNFTLYSDSDSVTNWDFQIPFRGDTNQLIISAMIDEQDLNLMIDTGSPVTVIDPFLSEKFETDIFKFQLEQQTIELKAYSQDLSVLADLGVVGILGGNFLQEWIITINPIDNVLYFRKETD